MSVRNVGVTSTLPDGTLTCFDVTLFLLLEVCGMLQYRRVSGVGVVFSHDDS